MRSRGFSLVEVMIVTGIVSIIVLAMANVATNISHSQQSLSQKMVAIDTQNSLSALLASPGQCNRNFSHVSWPTGHPPATIPVSAPGLQYYNATTGQPTSTAVRIGPQTNSYGLEVSSIELNNIHSLGSGNYTAQLQADFSGTTPALNPAKVSSVSLQTSIVGSNEVLEGCSSGSQTATVLGTFRLDTGATPVGFGASNNPPYSMNHIYCRTMTFTPGWTQNKVFLTGSVQYVSLASAQPANDHGYSFFPVGLNASTGSTIICVDNNSGQVYGTYSREIFTWTVWGMP